MLMGSASHTNVHTGLLPHLLWKRAGSAVPKLIGPVLRTCPKVIDSPSKKHYDIILKELYGIRNLLFRHF